MSQKVIMEFKRGTASSHTFKLPIEDYVAGSSLFFTAKPEIDNDSTDANAVINKEFTDAVVSLVTDPLYATYTLQFNASDIAAILFEDGETELDYLGEFAYVVPGDDPVRFPPDDEYITVKIFGNVKIDT